MAFDTESTFCRFAHELEAQSVGLRFGGFKYILSHKHPYAQGASCPVLQTQYVLGARVALHQFDDLHGQH